MPKSFFVKRLVFLGMTILFVPQLLWAGWTRTYGGEGIDMGYCVQQTSDGGYVIVGTTFSFGSIPESPDIWLLKTDSLGDTLWSKIYGGEADEGYCVQQTLDGGYIITGMTGPAHLLLLKTDSLGDSLWARTYSGGESDNIGYSIAQTYDGSYVVVGYTYSTMEGGEDLLLLKTDSLGDTLWTRIYGVEGHAFGHCVKETADSGYIITGQRYGDVWLLKTDSNGDTLWTQRYGGRWIYTGQNVDETTDGGYAIYASKIVDSTMVGFKYAYWLLKTDSNGDTLWTQTYGGDYTDWLGSGQATSDGGYVMVGTSSKGLWLIKTDSLGDSLWTRSYGESRGLGHWVQETTDRGYIITGTVVSLGVNQEDVWLIKTDSLGDTLAAITEQPVTRLDFEIEGPLGREMVLRYSEHPQGFRASIYDASGRKVDEIQACGSSGMVTWGEGHTSGVYFIRSDSDVSSVTQRLILLK